MQNTAIAARNSVGSRKCGVVKFVARGRKSRPVFKRDLLFTEVDFRDELLTPQDARWSFFFFQPGKYQS